MPQCESANCGEQKSWQSSKVASPATSDEHVAPLASVVPPPPPSPPPPSIVETARWHHGHAWHLQYSQCADAWLSSHQPKQPSCVASSALVEVHAVPAARAGRGARSATIRMRKDGVEVMSASTTTGVLRSDRPTKSSKTS